MKHIMKIKSLLTALLLFVITTVHGLDAPKPDKMELVRLATFKFKESATPEQIKAVEEGFAALKGNIPQIISQKWGTMTKPDDRQAKGFSHGLLLTFATEKDRDAYMTHPAHRELIKRVAPIMADITVFEFWDRVNRGTAALATAKDSPPANSAEAVHQRVTAKIERIKAGVQKMAEGGSDPSTILTTMQEKVGPLLDAGKITEAEPELDRVLKALGQEPGAGPVPAKPAAPPPAPAETVHTRIVAKVERIKAGAKKLAESGRDPSAIGQAMQEKFKPLMEAGNVKEAEAELDRVLELLKKEQK